MSTPAHILIVDDEAVSRDILIRRLTPRGFTVEGCESGQGCVEAIERRIPDLILLDVYMPKLDGIAVLKQLRTRWSQDLLPVILVTAMIDSDDVVAGFEAGANDYVVKPVNLPILLARIKTHLRIKNLAQSNERAQALQQANAQLAEEVTERRRIGEKLRSSEERFAKAFRASPDGLAISLRDSGKIIDINDSFVRMFGYSRDEIIGRSGLELGIVTSSADRDRAMDQLHATGTIKDFEAPARRKDGEEFPVALTAEAMDIGGEPCILMIVRDITERYRARQAMQLAHDELEHRVAQRTADLERANHALTESEQRFRNMADNSPMLLWIDGIDGACQFLNKSWLKFTGRRIEQELGWGWVQSVYPDDRQRCVEAFHAARAKRIPSEIEYRLRRNDGEYRWILDSSIPRFTLDGEFAGYMGSCIDITERRNAEDLLRRANDALRESEERFRTMADNAPVLLWMTGPDGHCTFVNRSWTDFTGRPLEAEIGLGWCDGLHPDDRERATEVWWNAFNARTFFDLDYRVRRHDGEYRWLFGTGHPRFMPDGKFHGYIGSCVDVTERRVAEQLLRDTAVELERRVLQRTAELARSNSQLQAEVTERRLANQQLLDYQGKLRALAAQVALAEERERRRIARGLHDEIGQSLAVMKMRLGSLREVATAPDKAKDHEEIRAALEKAITHIRSLTFELGSRILYEFGLETAIENLAEQLHRHGIDSTFHDDRQPKPLDEAIRVIVFQAVRELLHNVVKHAGAKHVDVRIYRESGDNGFDDCIHIEVHDDGVGFDHSQAGHNLVSEGGFGLFNVREQLDYLGGRLEIFSQPGEGTLMTIVVPLRREHADSARVSVQVTIPAVPAAT